MLILLLLPGSDPIQIVWAALQTLSCFVCQMYKMPLMHEVSFSQVTLGEP